MSAKIQAEFGETFSRPQPRVSSSWGRRVISLLMMLLMITFLWPSEMTPHLFTHGWQSVHVVDYQKRGEEIWGGDRDMLREYGSNWRVKIWGGHSYFSSYVSMKFSSVKKNYNLKKNINRFYCNTELNNYIFKPQVRTCNFYMPKYLGELSFNTSYN